jgi:hypothetical protein
MKHQAKLGLTALAAVVVLSACGASDIAPFQNAAPSGAFARGVVDHAKNLCTTLRPTWRLHGVCKVLKIMAKGSTAKLALYKGVSVDVVYGSASTTVAPSIVIADAMGGKDISGNQHFPLYGPKTCYVGYTCPGENVIYIEIDNPNAQTIGITGSTQYVVSAKKFPGKNCTPAGLDLNTNRWIPVSVLSVAPKDGKVTFVFPDGGLLEGDVVSYTAIACV